MRKMRPVNQSECRHGQFEGFRVLATHLATQRELSDVCDFCIQSLRRLLRCFPQKKTKNKNIKTIRLTLMTRQPELINFGFIIGQGVLIK